MRTILDWVAVYEVVADMETAANCVIDQFEEKKYRRRGTDTEGKLAVKVVHQRHSPWFKIIWFWQQFERSSGKQRGYRECSREISIPGGNYRYSLGQFKAAWEWEKALIRKMEDRFANIRRAQDDMKQLIRDNRAILRKAEMGEVEIPVETLKHLPW